MPQKTKKKSKKQPKQRKELSPWLIGGGIALAIIAFVTLMVLVIAPAMGYFATSSDWAKEGQERRKQATIEKEKKGLEAAAVVLSEVRQKLIDASPFFANLSEVGRTCQTGYYGFNANKTCSVSIDLPKVEDATYEQFDSMEAATEKILKSSQSFVISEYPQTIKTGLVNGAWDNTAYFKIHDYPEMTCTKGFVIREEVKDLAKNTWTMELAVVARSPNTSTQATICRKN